MKKILVILMGVLFLAGCGAAARESGFYEHNTMYKSWDHLKFSICGYDKVEVKEAELSKTEGWWGIPIEGKAK